MIYYGASGAAVGSSDNGWLFNEQGDPVGYISSGGIYHPKTGHRVGSITPGAVYNASNQPRAFSERFRLNLLAEAPQKLVPPPPVLKPRGPVISSEPAAELPAALATANLCYSLSELKD